jgi:hypothetical protein
MPVLAAGMDICLSQASKNDLIHYVSMRKCVLDLLAGGKWAADT